MWDNEERKKGIKVNIFAIVTSVVKKKLGNTATGAENTAMFSFIIFSLAFHLGNRAGTVDNMFNFGASKSFQFNSDCSQNPFKLFAA